MRRALIVGLLLISVFAPAADNKRNKFAMVKKEGEYVQLRNVPGVIAEQPCDNWNWAAGVEAILAKQDVALRQRDLILKLNGGLPCISPAPSFEELKRTLETELILPDRRRVRIEVNATPNLPETTDALLMPLAYGRPYLLDWRGHLYLVVGATWDEFVYHTGQKLMLIKKLSLINPAAKGAAREVEYDRERDGTGELGGMFDVKVVDMTTDSWRPPANPAMQ